MFRCLAGVLLLIGASGCNQIFGIPEAHPGNIDECATGLAACDPHATCTDTPDSYTCACASGYTGDGQTCADIDECAAAAPACSAHARCTNTMGSFSCACDPNFTGDGATYCVPSTFKQIAAAGGFTCGLGGDNGIYCWGSNQLGQLGDGTFIPHARPRQVGTDTDWTAVDARFLKACGLRTDHSMWCWGEGADGTLGDGKLKVQPSPVKVVSDKPGVGWKAMAVGRHRMCGIHDDGSLACWGVDNTTDPTDTTSGVPVAVGNNSDWTKISVSNVICGLRNIATGGNLFCFGKTTTGELGLGAVPKQATPAKVGTATWSAIGVGNNNTCGVQSTGALFCWGNSINSSEMQYGNVPVQVGIDTDWASVNISSGTAAGLRAGGNAFMWGSNSSGQAGQAQLGDFALPTGVSGTVSGWTTLFAGNGHSCGISAGKAYCWGTPGDGQLGDGVITNLYAPARIASDTWSSVSTASGGNCGIRADNALMCWGFSSSGLGFGNTNPVDAPTRVGTASWSAITSASDNGGFTTFCGLRAGTPVCFGDNSNGQIGIGNTTTPQLTPVAVNAPAPPNGTQWTEVATGGHTCALRSDGALFCWGNNANGQLGTGAASPGAPVTTPPVTPLAGMWLHVATASFFGPIGPTGETCAIKSDHTLWCWGFDPVTSTEHTAPIQLGTDADWATVVVAQNTVCAIKQNGSLHCRGNFIGDGTATPSPALVRVGPAVLNWKAISVGNETCGVRGDGTLWCWANDLGSALGDGSTGIGDPVTLSPPPALSPTQIGTDADWATVSSQPGGISCATRTNGSLWCWGFGAAIIPHYRGTPILFN